MLVTRRRDVEQIVDKFKSVNACMAIFCTASHWNAEAILLAAKKIGEKFGIEHVPVAVALTFQYQHMPQASMITYTRDARLGFLSVMKHLELLCDDPDSPYYRIQVLPHLDHAHPVNDQWALTKGLDYLASVMFDAQNFPMHENIELTRKYVQENKHKVMIEGVMDELDVYSGNRKIGNVIDNYPEKAIEYLRKTCVDFLVADLGTEQQSAGIGENKFLRNRAKMITRLSDDKILVLHGTSCLSEKEIMSLPYDGILRVNMWTRIAREAGIHAINSIYERKEQIQSNDFLAIESNRYIMDSTEMAARIMEHIMELLGYESLA